MESVKMMNDAVRARVITYFMSDLTLVDTELRRLIQEGRLSWAAKDVIPKAFMAQDTAKRLGIANKVRIIEKDTGYLSLHYQVKVSLPAVSDGAPSFELQVRTLAEELWGEIEHILGYKPGMPTSFAVKREFWVISRQLAALDEQFELLQSHLLRESVSDNTTEKDLLTLSNISAVLSRFNILDKGADVASALSLVNRQGIRYIGELHEVVTMRRVDLVRGAFLSNYGCDVGTLDLVDVLLILRKAVTLDEEAKLMGERVAFLHQRRMRKEKFHSPERE